MHQQVPAARFVVGALHERHAARVRDEIRSFGGTLGGLDVAVEAGRTRSLIAAASAAIAVSGSVSLELLAARVPTVIVYRIGAIAAIVQGWFRHARFITLVNLLACRDPIVPARGVWLPPREVPAADTEAVYPEYLAVQDPARHAAARVVEWLLDPQARRHTLGRIEAVAARVARSGSAARAAEAVLEIATRGESQAGGRFPTAAARAA